MTGNEAVWAKKKAALLQALAPLSRDEKANLILKASRYRSGADSCNSLYMGGLATASLVHALGGAYGRDDVLMLLTKATDAQIEAGLDVCANIIDYMRDHPTKPCPTCGQIMPDNGEPTAPTDDKMREVLVRAEQSLTSIAAGARNYIDGPSVAALLRDIRATLKAGASQ